MIKALLQKCFVVGKKVRKGTFTFFKKHFMDVIILVVTIIFGLIGIKYDSIQIRLQKDEIHQENFPFFQYEYSDGIFSVTGDQRTEITKVEWFFPTRVLSDGKQWELSRIGGHPLYLGYYEIRDYFAREIRVNTLLKEGNDAVVCNLYLFSENGIPAIVSVTYDKNDKQGLESMDFVLVTRIDTTIPEIIVQKNGRHINNDKGLQLFKGQLPFFNSAIEIMEEQKNRSCGFRLNQPFEGYINPNTSAPLKK